MSNNVKLAIRVRPFTDRELRSEKDRVPVVDVVDEKTVTITNLKVSASGAGDSRERVRQYHADYTFNSAVPPSHQDYASQEKVFESLGRDVMSCLSRLSSVCVLAYGQSATGKTHTMMGTEAQPGLVPRLCRELAGAEPCDVTISFLEIYNERVHDLLVGEDPPLPFNSLPRRRGNAQKDLRVREHPTRGPYVQNLRRVAVSDVETLLALVAEGGRRRRTAATRRNTTSSRSHALLELSTPRTTLHLADLAGSEKASWEGCCGGRQKEGANINKSLVALSNVISALVSGGRVHGRFVPYRDSALTWLLKDCFTGGACTFIIATVSPSVACYGESASTLRWSSRARQLPPPRATPPPRAAIQAHYNNLIAELTRHYIKYIPETGKIFYEDRHWTLQSKDVVNKLDVNSENTAKIGNLLSMLQPKADSVNNDEPIASPASSDEQSTMNKNLNIANEINEEVDRLLAPTLERTRSGSELEIVPPLRHKKHLYRSQEVLSIDKTLQDSVLRQYQPQISKTNDMVKSPQVPILYDNQRAEIVASVTERLYSKLKKKEETAVSKVETMVDKKIMEPLSELRICTNARQRLMELSQKALRNKRRIGIPAHTQTRKTVIRVKDQGIDTQTDLESYIMKDKPTFIIQCDASTETKPVTPRCKEIGIGPKCGSLHSFDKSTATETKPVILKSTFMMTDDATTTNRYTQTRVLPPPRRKRNLIYNKSDKSQVKKADDYITTPIISINISHRYAESESQSSDDNLEGTIIKVTDKTNDVGMTPDLLTNHNNIETLSKANNELFVIEVDENQLPKGTAGHHLNAMNSTNNFSDLTENFTEDFPEAEDLTLPRVSVNCSSKTNENDIKDIILGRNENLYPYNIVLSPYRDKDDTKKLVNFQETSISSTEIKNGDSKLIDPLKSNENKNATPNSDTIPNSDMINLNNDFDGTTSHAGTSSDSVESGRVDSDSFVWERGGICNDKPCNFKQTRYTPVFKSSSKYKTAKSRLYREFLGLAKDDLTERHTKKQESIHSDSIKDCSSSESMQSDNPQYKFLQSKKFFEEQYARYNIQNESYNQLEKQIFDSCNSLNISAEKYDRYLWNYRKNSGRFTQERTPKKYLQHLVQLRKDVIKADSDTTDSPI